MRPELGKHSFSSPQGRPVEWQALFWLAEATKIGAILGGSNYIAGRKKNVCQARFVDLVRQNRNMHMLRGHCQRPQTTKPKLQT
ncbi:MAG: hypothetical protein A3B11_00260 [Candidatus Taylorbacteria bacterium RIFCSPLOWO2_01_FULL_44_26]|uniref:Uncharacterized protein n=2 Tax=Candidatus Tayloriibacteriota TaxID=1817919 RepID=A0A1G2MKW6_9BACT|nr:MAG: hypothetical protein A3D50_01900 [Candidatus Taylorbacteria bacterium RIFCSPHIGHO2_02_FULL_44_12]OHA31121.1 MAG: hypothetical protein A3B11_00260 [Candidatus Taylorbacteria bacterium RIFCSPLOWO2_01_FULL_44_26]